MQGCNSPWLYVHTLVQLQLPHMLAQSMYMQNASNCK